MRMFKRKVFQIVGATTANYKIENIYGYKEQTT